MSAKCEITFKLWWVRYLKWIHMEDLRTLFLYKSSAYRSWEINAWRVDLYASNRCTLRWTYSSNLTLGQRTRNLHTFYNRNEYNLRTYTPRYKLNLNDDNKLTEGEILHNFVRIKWGSIPQGTTNGFAPTLNKLSWYNKLHQSLSLDLGKLTNYASLQETS